MKKSKRIISLLFAILLCTVTVGSDAMTAVAAGEDDAVEISTSDDEASFFDEKLETFPEGDEGLNSQENTDEIVDEAQVDEDNEELEESVESSEEEVLTDEEKEKLEKEKLEKEQLEKAELEDEEDEDEYTTELNATVELSSLVISAHAEVGVFPDGTTMEATEVTGDAKEEAVNAAIDAADIDETDDSIAVDITFYDKDGNEIEPEGDVDVTFSDIDMDGDTLQVFHIDDNSGDATAVTDQEENDGTIDACCDSFSTYVILNQWSENTQVYDGTAIFYTYDSNSSLNSKTSPVYKELDFAVAIDDYYEAFEYKGETYHKVNWAIDPAHEAETTEFYNIVARDNNFNLYRTYYDGRVITSDVYTSVFPLVKEQGTNQKVLYLGLICKSNGRTTTEVLRYASNYDSIVWAVKNYYVDFENAGDETIARQAVANEAGGPKIKLPTPTTRSGYTFKGWYDKADSSKKLHKPNEEVNITKDTTFVGEWALTSGYYNVTFENSLSSSETMYPVGVKKDSYYTLPECTFSEPEDKVFAGWKLKNTSTVYAEGTSVKITGNTTFVATYKDGTGPTTVNIYVNMGTDDDPDYFPSDSASETKYSDHICLTGTVDKFLNKCTTNTALGSAKVTLTDASKKLLKEKGISADALEFTTYKYVTDLGGNASAGYDKTGKSASHYHLYANLKYATLTLNSMDKESATQSTTKALASQVVGSTVTLPESVSGFNKENFKIKSWNTKADGTGTSYSLGAAYTLNQDTTLYAQWERVAYTVTIKDCDGYTRATKSYAIGSYLKVEDLQPVNIPSKCTFKGYRDSNETADDVYVSTETKVDSDMTLLQEVEYYAFSLPKARIQVSYTGKEIVAKDVLDVQRRTIIYSYGRSRVITDQDYLPKDSYTIGWSYNNDPIKNVGVYKTVSVGIAAKGYQNYWDYITVEVVKDINTIDISPYEENSIYQLIFGRDDSSKEFNVTTKYGGGIQVDGCEDRVTYTYKDGVLSFTPIKENSDTFTITVCSNGTSNYDSAYKNINFSIINGKLEVETPTATTGITYGENKPLVSYTIPEGISIKYACQAKGENAPADADYSTDIPTSEKLEAGDYLVYYTISKSGYLPVTGNVEVSIAKAQRSAGKISVDGWTYGSAASEPKYDATLGEGNYAQQGAVAYYALDSEGNKTGTAITPVNAGKYVAEVTYPENKNYEAVTITSDPFEIKKLTAEINWSDNTNLLYKEQDVTYEGATITNALANDVVAFTYSSNIDKNETLTAQAAGTYTAVITGITNDNYELPSTGLTKNWSINYLDNSGVKIVGTEGENGWYVSDVTLKNDKCKISILEGTEGNYYWSDFSDTSEVYTDDNADYCVYYRLMDESGNITNSETDTSKLGNSCARFKIDKTSPTGTLMDESKNSLLKNINAAIVNWFFKDKTLVYATSEDSMSGVDTVMYSLNGEDYKTLPATGVAIDKKGLNNLTMQVTDKAGNSVIYDSMGLVVYSDAELGTSDITYTRTSKEDKSLVLKLNGNTLKSLTLSDADSKLNPVLDADYKLSDNKIVFDGDYLDKFAAGNYTFTATFNPAGMEVDKTSAGATVPEDKTIKLTVVRQKDSIQTNYKDLKTEKVYDKKPLEVEYTLLSGRTLDQAGASVKYKDASGVELDSAPVNAGHYKAYISVPEDAYYAATETTVDIVIDKKPVSLSWTVENADGTKYDVSGNNISVLYNTKAYKVWATINNDCGEEVKLAMSGENYFSGTPEMTNVGNATVKALAVDNSNYCISDKTNDTLTWSIVYMSANDEDGNIVVPTISGNDTEDTDDYYNGTVTVTAPEGYEFEELKTAEGQNYYENSEESWSQQKTYSQDAVYNIRYRLRDKKGFVTDTAKEAISFKIDATAPTGELVVADSTFSSIIDSITYRIFKKDKAQVSFSSLYDNLSGVAKTEYSLDGKTFTEGGSFDVDANYTGVIFARITDKAGNVSTINSDGVVVFTDTTTDTESLRYQLGTNSKTEFGLYLSDNTIKSISLVKGEEISDITELVEIAEADEDGLTVVNIPVGMLEKLSTGNYTFSIETIPNGIDTSDMTEGYETTSVIKIPVVVYEVIPDTDDDDEVVYYGVPVKANAAVNAGVTIADTANPLGTSESENVSTRKSNAKAKTDTVLEDTDADKTDDAAEKNNKESSVEIKDETIPENAETPVKTDNNFKVLIGTLIAVIGVASVTTVYYKKRIKK